MAAENGDNNESPADDNSSMISSMSSDQESDDDQIRREFETFPMWTRRHEDRESGTVEISEFNSDGRVITVRTSCVNQVVSKPNMTAEEKLAESNIFKPKKFTKPF